MESPPENNNGMVHFSKINIFGDSGVGKSTFISKLINFKNDFPLIKNERNSDSFDITKNLVEQVQKVVVPLNEYKNMHFLLYETKVNDFEIIKTNLDTLLFQTECILIMWDQNNSSSFDMIPDLIKSIYSLESIKKENIFIFLIQNKTDLEFDDAERFSEEEIQQEIDRLKNTYKNIFERKMQLLNKEDLQNLLYDIDNYLANKKDNNLIDEKSVRFPYPMKEIKEEDIIKNINICLIGDINTGKSTFINKLIEPEENKKNKVELNYLISLNDEEIYLRIIDSPGKIEQKVFIDTILKKCQGILLIYDVTKRESFNFIKKWPDKIQSVTNGKIIIVANKIDEREGRVISKSEGQNLAKELSCDYYECSSIKGLNVNEIFNKMILLSYYIYKELKISRENSLSLSQADFNQINIYKDKVEKNNTNNGSGCCFGL